MRICNVLFVLLLPILSIDAKTESSNVSPSIRNNLTEHFAAARQKTLSFAAQNEDVRNKFDQFSQTLMSSYLAGEGLIDKDLLRIIDAIPFAAEKHQTQKRKNAKETPYIIHPIGVANDLMVIGDVRDPDTIIAALLHDTVEDTQTTFDEIEQKFGVRVMGFVKEVTDDKSLPKDKRKQLQVEHAPEKSAGAAQIKLADKLYNLTDLQKSPPPDWSTERINSYFVWAKSVVDRLPWVNAGLKEAVDKVISEQMKEIKNKENAMSKEETFTTPSGLKYQILTKAPDGAASPKAGQTVVVHYTGWLDDNGKTGKKFDSSVDRGQKFSFPIGTGRVIKGWDEGVLMMKVGEKRRLIIPANLGYGVRGAGASIPPNSTLIFDVELFEVK